MYITFEPVMLVEWYLLHSGEDSYQILSSNASEARQHPTKPSALCFAIEKRNRGALFRVVSIDDPDCESNAVESNYFLEYTCPLSVLDTEDDAAPVNQNIALGLYVRRLSTG